MRHSGQRAVAEALRFSRHGDPCAFRRQPSSSPVVAACVDSPLRTRTAERTAPDDRPAHTTAGPPLRSAVRRRPSFATTRELRRPRATGDRTLRHLVAFHPPARRAALCLRLGDSQSPHSIPARPSYEHVESFQHRTGEWETQPAGLTGEAAMRRPSTSTPHHITHPSQPSR
jgi:hypothetical protein